MCLKFITLCAYAQQGFVFGRIGLFNHQKRSLLHQAISSGKEIWKRSILTGQEKAFQKIVLW